MSRRDPFDVNGRPRLSHDRLLVTDAEITERDVNLAPVRQRLGAVVLVDDAPLP
jgi:hypothetical protein